MAGTYDIDARQGTALNRTITITVSNAPLDITGYTARLQVRRHAAQSGTPLLDLTVGSGITISDPTGGEFTVYASASTMAALPDGQWVYDLEVTPASGSADTFALLAGKFTVAEEVTR